MKRSKPIARSATPMRRTGSLRARSKRTEQVYAGSEATEGRRAFVARLLKERPLCQAGAHIGDYVNDHSKGVHTAPGPDWVWRWERCTMQSVDVHELLARSAGGSILDESNVICVCRTCHTWIGDHPKAALELGLRRSRYPGRNP